jgi:hypothetical protein
VPGPSGFSQGFTQGRKEKTASEMDQLTLESGRFKLDELKRDRAEMLELQEKLKGLGQDPDLNKFFDTISATGNPKYVEMANQGRQKLKDQLSFANILGGGAAPQAAPQPQAAPSEPYPGYNEEIGMAAPANALAARQAPAPMQPQNAMVSQQPGGLPTQDQINAAYRLGTPAAIDWANKAQKFLVDSRESQLDRASREGISTAGIAGRASEGQLDRGARAAEGGLNRAATAANIQPTAPTVTQIVDPTDSNRMIAIDAKRYQGGGAGSPGVIGVSGREPGAALRINKAEEGKTQLADDLDNLRGAFMELDRMRAIPSTQRGSISNVASSIAASGVGQMSGRAFGTTAQVEREVINSARTRLVNSIKNATGMSAQQLNSNVELQTMLRSIADSGQPLQAAMRIIDDIENAYVIGAGKLPKDKGKASGGGVDTSNPLLR